MSRQHIRLDAVTPEGRARHELVADARALDNDDADADSENGSAFIGSDGLTPGRALALVGAVADAREDARLRAAEEAEAVRRREQADESLRRMIAHANAMLKSLRADALGTLSPQQIEVVRARIEIADEGDVPTHHEVARRLGLHPAAVSRQWARIVAKLARAEDEAVSTRAA